MPLDERFCQASKYRDWDKNKHNDKQTFYHHEKLLHINSFVCVRLLLEPMRLFVCCLQEVYFRFKMNEEIILYSNAASLTDKLCTEKKKTCFCGEQINRNNIPSEVVKQYW